MQRSKEEAGKSGSVKEEKQQLVVDISIYFLFFSCTSQLNKYLIYCFCFHENVLRFDAFGIIAIDHKRNKYACIAICNSSNM